MTSYTDSAGRLWLVRIDVDAARRALAVAGVDLLGGSPSSIVAAASDPVTLTDVLYGLCLPQAAAAGVGRSSFEAGLFGPAIDAGSEAVLSAVFDSLPPADPNAIEADAAPDPDAPAPDVWRLASELAARAGIAPGPHTLRELVWAANARESAEWCRASFVLAAIANADQRRKRPVRPDDLNPFRRPPKAKRRGRGVSAETLSNLFAPRVNT